MKYNDLSHYNYLLPKKRIAQFPAVPRDASKLLVYDRVSGKQNDSTFFHLADFIPEGSLLVFNNTKVIPARIYGKRRTGGKIEILFLEICHPRPDWGSSFKGIDFPNGTIARLRGNDIQMKSMISRHLDRDEVIMLDGGLEITVIEQQEKYYIFSIPLPYSSFLIYLEKNGEMPIPPYIDHPHSKEKLKKEYQSIFAKVDGSVAAPTASLHFTNRLFKKLKAKKIEVCYVTLHVGLGTFAPLTEDAVSTKRLHHEFYNVSKKTWDKILRSKSGRKKIITVGTTATRTVETIAATGILSGSTELFIQPGYEFKMVDGLITNFHLPKSSLLLLVSAFIGSREKTLDLYHYALKSDYRFFSFGDGTLIL